MGMLSSFSFKTEEITFTQLAELIISKDFKYVVALTGAGVSAESGIPTFRDPGDGLWKKYNPAVYSSIAGYIRHPEKIWELIRDFIQTSNPEPNPSHTALAELERLGLLKSIITQNVDRLHQEAGSKTVIEYHGNLFEASCWKCNKPAKTGVKDLIKAAETLPPRCLDCNGPLKPSAVLFGEAIPGEAIQRADLEAKKCDLMLVIGTSAKVFPVCQIPKLAANNNAVIVEINLEKTPLTNSISNYRIIGKSSGLMNTVRTLMEHRSKA